MKRQLIIAILIICLLLAPMVGVSCVDLATAVHLLISGGLCGLQVHLNGELQGTLQHVLAWGVCMLEIETIESEQALLEFIFQPSVLTEYASASGIELKMDSLQDPITLGIQSAIVHGTRLEIDIQTEFESLGLTLTAPNENGFQIPTILVEVSDTPFDPHLLVYPAMSCQPLSFAAMLYPDTASSTTIRIGNEGDAILTYNLYDRTQSIPHELIYDDGECDIGHWWQGEYKYWLATRFTPSSYPVSLHTASIYLKPNAPDSDHEQFAVEVYDNDGPGGAPGSMLGRVYTTAADWGWWDVDISGLGVRIYDGDFYIAYSQLTSGPNCEALCVDVDEPRDYRSWAKLEGLDWYQWTSGSDIMIRCVVDVFEDCPWLGESLKSGSMEPGNSDSITLSISAIGLAPGDYEADIVITSNDPNMNPTIVPVELVVQNPPLTPPEPAPSFVADKVDVDVGEVVTFHNWTMGGTHPYTKAEWDFNADGIIDQTRIGTEANVMADVTYTYNQRGVYTVRLWMTDSTPITRFVERPNYIMVGDYDLEDNWRFNTAGFFPRHLPDNYYGQVVLADLYCADIPACVQGVWWHDAATLEYRFWVPCIGGSLTTLGGGHTYDYQVLVTGACEWEIPFP